MKAPVPNSVEFHLRCARGSGRPALPASEIQFQSIHGDCLTQMRALAAASVDVAVTVAALQPRHQVWEFDDTSGREDYLRWTVEWCREVKRLLRDTGSFFLTSARRRAIRCPARSGAGVARGVRPAKYFSLDQVHHG